MKITSYLKTTLVSIVGLVFLIGLWIYVALFTTTISQPNGMVYNLRPGLGKKTFIAEVYEQNIIHHPWLMTAYISFFPNDQLKAGEYLFPNGSSPASIWRQVTTGSGMVRYAFTIIPGWTFVQLKQSLAQIPILKHSIQGMDDKTIMQKLGAPTVAPEGEFFPDTYYYTRGMNDFNLLKRAYSRMQKKLALEWQTRDPNVYFKTPYDALIAASIIEKEAYLPSERPIIAGVLINRLKNDMLLQFDPTVIYGMGENYQGKIHKSDLIADTPYNTYVHKGLPPTPIAMPSLSSMNAVLHPQQNTYFYFVARGDGSHQFSQTLVEHNAAVAAALIKAKEIQKSKPESYINPSAGQRYLQSIITPNTVQTL